jgi:hypothetical protein
VAPSRRRTYSSTVTGLFGVRGVPSGARDAADRRFVLSTSASPIRASTVRRSLPRAPSRAGRADLAVVDFDLDP